MDLSIVILNYNNKDLIRELLKNIRELNLAFDYEIIVVDNASYDGIDKVVAKFPEVKFIQSKANNGFGAGNNIGIKASAGKYVLVLNPDLAILSDAIEVLYQFMEDHPEVGLAGPRLIYGDKTTQYSCTQFPDWHLPFYRRTFLEHTKKGQVWLDNYLMKDFDHRQNAYVPTLFGACLIVRQAVLSKVGLFDEQKYFMYMEDLDWSRRFWQAGYKVAYVGQAEVIHLHLRESASEGIIKTLFNKLSRQHILSFIKYLWKFRGKEIPKIN